MYRAGQCIVQGLLAALLAVSALARVHKVCSIIVEMTGLSYPGGQTPDSCIAGWLHSSIQQLPPGELCACQACIDGIEFMQPIYINITNVHSKCKGLCLCCRAYGGSGASQICIRVQHTSTVNSSRKKADNQRRQLRHCRQQSTTERHSV